MYRNMSATLARRARHSSLQQRNLGPTSLTSLIQRRNSSISFEKIESDLLSRQLPLLSDTPTGTPSILLDATLSDILPPFLRPWPGSTATWDKRTSAAYRPGHHLLYFPPRNPLSSLLPDGTDPAQSPGAPFVRRMWAGGRIDFLPTKGTKFRMMGERMTCLERITKVSTKGKEGEEKIFVTVERRFTGLTAKRRHPWFQADSVGTLPEDQLRKALLHDKCCSLVEERDLVFMRERTPEQAADAAKMTSKYVKHPHKSSYSISLTPTPSLLFRFSALTFNAHRIHLDKSYCNNTEGHRNLLVHGPLSLMLMLEVLNRYLADNYGVTRLGNGGTTQNRAIASIQYRNIAPLYAEELMNVCLHDRKDGGFDVWVENQDGGLAVKGTAKTVSAAGPKGESSKHITEQLLVGDSKGESPTDTTPGSVAEVPSRS